MDVVPEAQVALLPYRARVDERWFLNLPGFDNDAYVLTFVEDTSERGLEVDPYCEGGCTCCPSNFEPRMILEISSGRNWIRLGFDIDTPAGRVNSLHKLDVLMSALQVFRSGVIEEFEPYDRRERELEA